MSAGGYIENHCREVDGELVCDFRGHRYRAPWLCLCCGVETGLDQWRYGRTCARCDTGACYDKRTAEYEPGHGREDIVASAEVSSLTVWCASKECAAHATLNRIELGRRVF